LATVIVLAFYVAVPDKVNVVVPIAGTDVFQANRQAFPIRGWSVLYAVAWSLAAISLLVNVVVRHRLGKRRAAIVLGVLVLVSAIATSLGPRLLPGALKVTGPALGNALLSVAFAGAIARYRLYSTRDEAIRLALDNLNDGILVLQADRTVLSCNTRATELLGLPRESMVNVRVDSVLARSALPSEVWRDLWARLRQGQGSTSEARYTLGEDEQIVSNKVMPIYDARQDIEGYVWVISDVTLLRRGEAQIEARNRELQEAVRELRSTSEIQQRLLETVRSLSAPAVPIMEGIIVMPLSGQIDSLRAQRILDNLLAGIGDYQAKIALIDITGVPVVDTAVAQYLIQTARAASLMGCHPILVGIRPEIAQVIVELGIDMSGLVTFSDLQSGFEYALRTLDIGLVHTASV
jgi:PAS domain S-box-containing protein